jgi:hypothetical protein
MMPDSGQNVQFITARAAGNFKNKNPVVAFIFLRSDGKAFIVSNF